jgi:hypothetical protein
MNWDCFLAGFATCYVMVWFWSKQLVWFWSKQFEDKSIKQMFPKKEYEQAIEDSIEAKLKEKNT